MYLEKKWMVEEPWDLLFHLEHELFQLIVKHIFFNKAIKNRPKGQLLSSVLKNG